MDCLLCLKHKDQGDLVHPPGGYIYEDEHWLVCRTPVNKGSLGTLFIASRRHFLDYAEMTAEESTWLGDILKNAYSALREQTEAERIYQVSMMEGVPHFHAWLIPRTKDVSEHGAAFLAKDLACTSEEAEKLSAALRQMLA